MHQGNARKKVQSAFLLPDLYVGYTTDFNRATAQVAMEVTEKQVFQPERKRLAWVINNKLLNSYGFKYVKTAFAEPDITNPDDMMKLLNISERAGGMTLNEAKELTATVLGKEAENYPDSFNMEDIGNVPLALISKMPALSNYGTAQNNLEGVDERLRSALQATDKLVDRDNLKNRPDADVEDESKDVDLDLNNSKIKTTEQLESQINKAANNGDVEVVAIMKEVRRLLTEMGGDDNETD
ncbi:MAG: hypothetical protein IJ141_10710 [Lachnospiraceae bacterium]|nr:hypothetical protein [Lachnospiraceae bacterium]